VILKAIENKNCEATVTASIRPVGKDMSNQAAVHKAFLLVFDEIKDRYGVTGGGLLDGFLSVVDDMANDGKKKREKTSPSKESKSKATSPRSPSATNYDGANPSLSSSKRSQRQVQVTLPAPTVPIRQPKASQKAGTGKDSGLVSFDNMLRTGRESPEITRDPRPSTPSLLNQVPESDPAKRLEITKPTVVPRSDEFDLPRRNAGAQLEAERDPVMIEVKPLPKIRLSLMPSPREEDEEEVESVESPKKKKKSKKPKKTRKSGTGRKRESSRF